MSHFWLAGLNQPTQAGLAGPHTPYSPADLLALAPTTDALRLTYINNVLALIYIKYPLLCPFVFLNRDFMPHLDLIIESLVVASTKNHSGSRYGVPFQA